MKKLLNINKINKLYKNSCIYTYNLPLKGQKQQSNLTHTYSQTTLSNAAVANLCEEIARNYPICPNCHRSLPNNTFLHKNSKSCIWCRA